MGVEGSGKTTIGRMLAGALGCEFHDADDFHSPEAKSKMAAGLALTDEDRRPWLDALRGLIVEHLRDGLPMVLACSALKVSYREVLMVDLARVVLVYLRGDQELIRERLQQRSGHYAGVCAARQPIRDPRGAARCGDHRYREYARSYCGIDPLGPGTVDMRQMTFLPSI